MPSLTCSGISSRSLALPWGKITCLILLRRAAMTFSFKPPMGSTLPTRESSPVIASDFLSFLPVARERSAEASVIPADGPSLGVAPAGTCRWMRFFSQKSGLTP